MVKPDQTQDHQPGSSHFLPASSHSYCTPAECQAHSSDLDQVPAGREGQSSMREASPGMRPGEPASCGDAEEGLLGITLCRPSECHGGGVSHSSLPSPDTQSVHPSGYPSPASPSPATSLVTLSSLPSRNLCLQGLRTQASPHRWALGNLGVGC